MGKGYKWEDPTVLFGTAMGFGEQCMAFTLATLQFYQGLGQYMKRAQAADLHILEGVGFTSALTEWWSVSCQHHPLAIGNRVYFLNCRGGCVPHLWDRLEERKKYSKKTIKNYGERRGIVSEDPTKYNH